MRRPWVVALGCAAAAAGLAAAAALLVAGLTGTDDAATGVIGQTDTAYRPWAASVWQPGSTAAEVALFALQAALGGGVLGYVLAALRRRRGAVKDG